MRILFSTSSLFPYRVNWLDELGKYADVDVYYLKDDDSARNTQWCAQRPENCSYTKLKSWKIPKLGELSFGFINVLKKHRNAYDAIILDGYGFLSQMLNIWYLNRKKIPYYVNVDGIVPEEKKGGLRTWLKRKIIKNIPCCLCGAFATNEILKHYGSEDGKIVNHPFTSLYKKDIAESVATEEEKARLREKLGIKEKYAVISVGRFSYMNGYGKGYDVLLRSASQMSKDIGWYIVGGQPTEEFRTMQEQLGVDQVHFVDFLKKEDLAEYYRACDVFVLMTVGDVWGLVINEAMAYGLPVITTDKCVAGLDLVENDANGYIIKVGDDRALTEKLNGIFVQPERISKMGEVSLEKIAPYTIENMAKIHISALEESISR